MPERFPDCYRMLVQGIELKCLLGVYEHEQRQPRSISVEVELFVPINARAAQSDELGGTINYEVIVAAIHRVADSRRFKLVESLCSAFIDDLARLPGLRALKVAVEKPAPMAGMRSVRIEQWRRL